MFDFLDDQEPQDFSSNESDYLLAELREALAILRTDKLTEEQRIEQIQIIKHIKLLFKQLNQEVRIRTIILKLEVCTKMPKFKDVIRQILIDYPTLTVDELEKQVDNMFKDIENNN